MTEYITADQVNELLGHEWAPAEQKARAVLMANAWLTDKLRGRVFDEVPAEVVLAGAEVARESAAGNLYGSQGREILSETRQVDGAVSKSVTYAQGSKAISAGESFAMALLKPWLRGSVMMLKRC